VAGLCYLQELPEACDHATPNELGNIHARGPDGCRVGTSDAINPFHGENPRPAEVPPHPGYLHLGVITEVPVEVVQATE